VPGLDPMSVQEVVGDDDEHFDVAFIQDTQQRRWVIRAPRTEVAAAHMDASLAMLALLVRRVPFAVPAAKGFAPIPKVGRAAVHSYIPGHPLDLAALQPGHPVTAEVGRTIAMIHNVDRALYDEAGLASYDAESYRRRHLAEIDRGAATGRVPAGLLGRWEEALDDVRLWRFAPTPVHGALSGSDILVTFPNPTDASSATVRGVTGWESAKVADPADDFAALVGEARPDVVDAVLTAYAHVRVERPDEHLLARARLVNELELLATLLRAVGMRDEVATEATTARLRRLDDTVHSETRGRRLRIVPAPPVSTGASGPGRGAGPPSSEAAGTDPRSTSVAEPTPDGRDETGTGGDDEPGTDGDGTRTGPGDDPGSEQATRDPSDDVTDVIEAVDPPAGDTGHGAAPDGPARSHDADHDEGADAGRPPLTDGDADPATSEGRPADTLPGSRPSEPGEHGSDSARAPDETG
jgi:macrolide phosphotransferase